MKPETFFFHFTLKGACAARRAYIYQVDMPFSNLESVRYFLVTVRSSLFYAYWLVQHDNLIKNSSERIKKYRLQSHLLRNGCITNDLNFKATQIMITKG